MILINVDKTMTIYQENKYCLFVAWKANKSIQPGLYLVTLLSNNSEFTISEFFYDGNADKWNTFGSKDEIINIINGNRIEIVGEKFLEYTSWSSLYKNFEARIVDKENRRPQDFKFRILLEDINVNKLSIPNFNDFIIDTDILSNAFLTSRIACPINPSTGLPMKICLNWRRTDDIGKDFIKILNSDNIKNSIVQFCSSNKNAEDCMCINRNFFHEYIRERKNFKTIDDYCWYKPCKSGSYLVLKDKVNCNGVYCITQYNAQDVNGNLIFSQNNSVQNCSTITVPDKKPNKDNDINEEPKLTNNPTVTKNPKKSNIFDFLIKNKKEIIIIISLFFIFIFLSSTNPIKRRSIYTK